MTKLECYFCYIVNNDLRTNLKVYSNEMSNVSSYSSSYMLSSILLFIGRGGGSGILFGEIVIKTSS